VAWRRLEGNGPRNFPYFLRKIPLNHNSSLRPFERTRIKIAGVSAKKRDRIIPLFGKSD